MALVFRDRVQETTTTTGTGTLTLAGAVTGFQAFSAIGNGNTCYYSISEVDANGNPSGAWEVGLGTYTLSGTTLARTSVIASSNSDALVNFAAGTKRVACVNPASGTVIVRQPGGTAGVDEVQISHDGTNGIIETKDGRLIATTPSNSTPFRITTAAVPSKYIDIWSDHSTFSQAITVVNDLWLSGGDLAFDTNKGLAFSTGAATKHVRLQAAANKVLDVGDGAGSVGATLRSKPLSPAALTANQNNYNPGVARRYRLATDGTGNKNITGLSISQVDGQECSIVNVSAADTITLTHQDAASTAANEFICSGAANIVLAVNEEALLWYDSTTARWRVRKI